MKSFHIDYYTPSLSHSLPPRLHCLTLSLHAFTVSLSPYTPSLYNSETTKSMQSTHIRMDLAYYITRTPSASTATHLADDMLYLSATDARIWLHWWSIL